MGGFPTEPSGVPKLPTGRKLPVRGQPEESLETEREQQERSSTVTRQDLEVRRRRARGNTGESRGRASSILATPLGGFGVGSRVLLGL